MGADIAQLRAILDVKLMLDDRKPLNVGRRQNEQKKPRKAMTLLGMFIFFIVGCVYLFPLMVFADNRIMGLWAFLTLFLFMLTFSLITDFANVLVDTKDKIILFSRPVNDKTIFLSRMLHIFIYLFRMVFPMSLAAWGFIAYSMGWLAALLYPLVILLLVFMALFFVNGTYLLLLKVVKPARFKEIINYLQIAFSVVLFSTYYLLPRVMENAALQQVSVNDYPWVRWFPTYWLASVFSWVGTVPSVPVDRWLSLLAVAFPVFCLYASVRWLAPNFTGLLSEADTDAPPQKVVKKGGAGRYKRLAELFNRSSEARAGFTIAWLQTARSRTFKMRVYPSFAYVPIYFLYMFFINTNKPMSEVWASLSERSGVYLALLYMTSFVMLQALGYVVYSEQYKAAWIYYASPTSYPGKIMAGAYKAMWVKFFLPLFASVSLFVLYVWGLPALLDVVLALVNVMVFTLLIMRFSYRQLPFSQLEQMNNKAGKGLMRMLLTFLSVGIMGVGHFMAVNFWWLKLLFLLLSSALIWLIWDSFTKTTWDNLEGVEEDM